MLQNMELTEIQEALKQSGARWQAAATPLLELSPQQRRLRLGAKPPADMQELQRREQEAGPQSQVGYYYPAGFDLRNVSGANYITPVKDQGNCGSCVAFGTTATVEGTLRWQRKNPNLAVDLSEAQLFYCIAASEGRNCESGWWPGGDNSHDGALNGYQYIGVVDEACFPYTAGDQACKLCSGWQEKVTKITGWQRHINAADMKAWLSTRGPLTACFDVYEDFFHYGSGIYTHVWGKKEELQHCVCVVGYDDYQGYWICKNSWGTRWGEGGFFRIAYGQCRIDEQMWTVEHVLSPGLLAMTIYDSDRSGQFNVAFSSADMGAGSGALAWLMADVNGDGKDEIIQLWDNQGLLAIIGYGSDGSGGYTITSRSANMGTGSSALAWLAGDVNGDGKDEIIQLWSGNPGDLGMTVYGSDGSGGYIVIFSSADMGAGSGALAWLTGDVNGDGKAEIIQLWDNHDGHLGMTVYGSGSDGYTITFSSVMPTGPDALAWLASDVNGDGKTEIVQLWDNHDGHLGVTVYGSDGNGKYIVIFSSVMPTGPIALAWLTGDMNGDGKAEIVQLWNNP